MKPGLYDFTTSKSMQPACEDDLKPFPVRCYGKGELAAAYNPEIAPHSALNKLAGWIKRNRKLYEALLETGYSDRQQSFTPKQVRLIFEYLGEP